MKMRPAADDLLERVAITFNLAPLPGAHALYGMTAGRVVGVAQKLGIFGVLLAGPATAGRVAEQLDLQVAGTRLLCENLAGLGILDQDGHTFSVAKPSRKWLDPASPTYVGTWLEHTASYWPWYGDIERIVREGGSFEIHREPAEDEEYWRVYITGQYELARLSAEEVAKAIKLPPNPTRPARRGGRPRLVRGVALPPPPGPEGDRAGPAGLRARRTPDHRRARG